MKCAKCLALCLARGRARQPRASWEGEMPRVSESYSSHSRGTLVRSDKVFRRVRLGSWSWSHIAGVLILAQLLVSSVI